jgi:PAS domain S-box-containing protein
MRKRGENSLKFRASEWLKGAKGRSARIAAIYLLAGSAWIVLSDSITRMLSADVQQAYLFAVVKGLLYVLVTALLVYSLVYRTLREVFGSRETILRMNRELTESSRMYKGLSEAYWNRQALLQGLIDSIPDLIFHKDQQCRYLGCNRAFREFAHREEAEIAGRLDGEFLTGDIAEMFLEGDGECLDQGETRRYENVITPEDGDKRYFETIKTPYRDAGGNIIGLIGVSRDVTKRRLEEERILYLSTHDTITGFHNRVFLADDLKRLDQPEHLPLTVVMGDINGLKLINDSLGHARGDRVI